MPWRLTRAPLANHVAPTHDIRPHNFVEPCWCGAYVDHPNSDNVIHEMFLPDDTEDDDDNPDEE